MPARRLAALCVLLTPSLALADPPARPRLDAHGFPLPEGAIARIGDLHYAQPGPITALAMSADGKVVATGGFRSVRRADEAADGAGKRQVFQQEWFVRLWDAASGIVSRELTAPGCVSHLALSADGGLVAAGMEKRVSAWEVATGKALWADRDMRLGPDEMVTALRFIDGGRLLAVVYSGCVVRLRSATTGELVRTWEVDDQRIKERVQQLGTGYQFTSVALSPSGEQMACLVSPKVFVRDNCAVLLYETASGRLLRKSASLSPKVLGIDLLDEGQTLLVMLMEWTGAGPPMAVVGFADGRARDQFRYDYGPPPSRPDRQITPGVPGFIVAVGGGVLFMQDGRGLTCREVKTGRKLMEWDYRCRGLALSPDGKVAAVARGARWHLCDERLRPLRPGTEFVETPEVRYLPDGRLLASTHWSERRVNVWDARRGKLLEGFSPFPAPASHRWPISHDSLRKVCAFPTDTELVVHDLLADRKVCSLAEIDVKATGGPPCPVLSSDGRRVLVTGQGDDPGLVRWFDSRTGRELGRYSVPQGKHRNPLTRAEWFSEDGSVFGYLTDDNRLALVDCGRREVCQVVGNPAHPAAAPESWPPGGAWKFERVGDDRLLLASRDGVWGPERREFALWDRKTGQLLRRVILPPEGENDPTWYWSLSWDGRFMAVQSLADREVVVCETASGRRRGKIQSPHPIQSFSFSPDGKSLAGGCDDTTVLLWDLDRPLSSRLILPAPRTAAEADRLWQVLGDHDPAEAERALWALVRHPAQALPLLRQRLRPARVPDPDPRPGLIARLDSPNFKQREAAARDLTALGELAVPALRAAVAGGKLALEQRRRAEQLLTRLDDPAVIPPCLRELRAVEALERIGSAEARALLAEVAGGTADALLTREARLALTRLRHKQ
jgi:WD40 repeat protein